MTKIIRLCTLIVFVFVCFRSIANGQTPAAEAAADTPTAESVISDLTAGKQSADTSISSVVDSISKSMTSTASTAETVKSAVAGTLVVEEQPIPEVNQNITEAVDAKTGRYPPRLKIDFNEFPLRSVEKQITAGDSDVHYDSGKDIAQRIKNRLREPDLKIAVKDRTATVRGEFKSQRNRILAETMLRVEAGIDNVVVTGW